MSQAKQQARWVVAPPASRQASLRLPESTATPGQSPVNQRAQKLATCVPHVRAQALDPRPQGLLTTDQKTQRADTNPRIPQAPVLPISKWVLMRDQPHPPVGRHLPQDKHSPAAGHGRTQPTHRQGRAIPPDLLGPNPALQQPYPAQDTLGPSASCPRDPLTGGLT